MIAKRVPYQDLPKSMILRIPAIVSGIEDLIWAENIDRKNFEDSRDLVAGILFLLVNGVCVRHDYQIGLRHAIAQVITDYFSGLGFKDSVGVDKSLMNIGLSIVAELDVRRLYVNDFFPYTANSLVSERGDVSFTRVQEGLYIEVLGKPGI